MPKLTPRQWKNMRAEYETHGPSVRALEKKYDIGRQSIYARKKAEGWVKGGRVAEAPVATDLPTEAAYIEDLIEPTVLDMTVEVPTPAITVTPDIVSGSSAAGYVGTTTTRMTDGVNSWDPDEALPEPQVDEAAVYQARIAELEAALAEATTTAAGVAHVPFFETVEDLIEGLDDEILNNAATAALGHINIERMKIGQLPLDFNEHPELLAEQIHKIASELIARRTKFRGRVRLRNIKMWNPAHKMLVQVPVEDQINNEAAQEGAAIWKAKDAGLLIADPYRCQAWDCGELAKLLDDGKTMALNGYCSDGCRATDPYIKAPQPQGLSTSFGSLRRG